MTPCYILPCYGLYLLYDSEGDQAAKLAMARKIDRMTVKIENETTRRVKSEIRKFLSAHELGNHKGVVL